MNFRDRTPERNQRCYGLRWWSPTLATEKSRKDRHGALGYSNYGAAIAAKKQLRVPNGRSDGTPSVVDQLRPKSRSFGSAEVRSAQDGTGGAGLFGFGHADGAVLLG